MDLVAHWPPERIASGVVLYHPRPSVRQLIEVLARQFETVFAVENESEAFDAAADGPSEEHAVRVQRNRENAGLARAINQLCESARQAGFEWLVLFDQDSEVPPDFRSRFARFFSQLADPPALLAANYRTELCGETFTGYRLEGGQAIGEQVTGLNAGSLINLTVHRELGGHSEALFVDHVDHEYCLRLRRHDYPVLVTREPLFTHEVGNIVSGRWLGRVWQSGGHSPARRREATEALVRVVKSYWRAEPGWCARMLFLELPRSILAMLVLERQRKAKSSAFAAGFVRGIFRSKTGVS